jgi:hypothetical protein
VYARQGISREQMRPRPTERTELEDRVKRLGKIWQKEHKGGNRFFAVLLGQVRFLTPAPHGAPRAEKTFHEPRSIPQGRRRTGRQAQRHDRAERIAKLTEDKKLDPKSGKVLGLPKTLVSKKG